MAERFLGALREAVQEIAETMLFTEVQQGEWRKGNSPLTVAYSAVLGYSESLKGSFALSAPEGGAIALAGALLGEEREQMDDEMEDAFCEMANMMAGGMQSRLEAQLGPVKLSTPVVIQGEGHKVRSEKHYACVSQDFILNGLAFCVHIFYDIESLERM
ncbi:chemotaxis protein CheX [Magnetococcus sp. PR-3]|uniref:chemotaxis protein CheX n=1 Tax=Magnetococcus sp. PR-3 TaxID=3120355 RepID=UPI002FCDE997